MTTGKAVNIGDLCQTKNREKPLDAFEILTQSLQVEKPLRKLKSESFQPTKDDINKLKQNDGQTTLEEIDDITPKRAKRSIRAK